MKKIFTIFFYKNKKVIKIDDIDLNKILVAKENPSGLNTLLDTMITMLLDH